MSNSLQLYQLPATINTKHERRKQQHRKSGAYAATQFDNSIRRALRKEGAAEYTRSEAEYANVINETTYDIFDFERVFVFEESGFFVEAWAETDEGQMIQIIEDDNTPNRNIRLLAEFDREDNEE